MYREGPYRYYQPEYKVPVYDVTIPNGLFSFQAFRTYDEAVNWLRLWGYNPDNFDIKEYKDNDIEEVTLLDENGDIIPRIEDFGDYALADEILGRIIKAHGGEENLRYKPQEGENRDIFMDRVYGDAMEFISDECVEMEKEGNYNFQLYCGNPYEEWYDEAREIAVNDLMEIMLEGVDEDYLE